MLTKRLIDFLWGMTGLAVLVLSVATVRLFQMNSSAAVAEAETPVPTEAANPTATPGPTPTPTHAFSNDPLIGQTVYLLGRDLVMLYQGPSAYQGVFRLPLGTTAVVLDRHPERYWYHVDTGDYIGWVQGNMLSTTPPAESTPDANEADVGMRVYVVGEEDVPMREDPGENTAVVSSLSPGTSFVIQNIYYLGPEDAWYQVRIARQNGWVSAAQTSLTEPE